VRELLGALEIGAGYRRNIHHRTSFSHVWAFSMGKEQAELPRSAAIAV
jgi:hypothetical protein